MDLHNITQHNTTRFQKQVYSTLCRTWPLGAQYVSLFFSPLFSAWVLDKSRCVRFTPWTNHNSVRIAIAVSRRPTIGWKGFFSKGAYFSSHLDWIFSLIQGTLNWYLLDISSPKFRSSIVRKVENPTIEPGRARASDRRGGGELWRWRWRCRSWNYRLASG